MDAAERALKRIRIKKINFIKNHMDESDMKKTAKLAISNKLYSNGTLLSFIKKDLNDIILKENITPKVTLIKTNKNEVSLNDVKKIETIEEIDSKINIGHENVISKYEELYGKSFAKELRDYEFDDWPFIANAIEERIMLEKMQHKLSVIKELLKAYKK